MKKEEKGIKRIYRVGDGDGERYYRYLSKLCEVEGLHKGTLRNWFLRNPKKVYHKHRKLVDCVIVDWDMLGGEKNVNMEKAHMALVKKAQKQSVVKQEVDLGGGRKIIYD